MDRKLPLYLLGGFGAAVLSYTAYKLNGLKAKNTNETASVEEKKEANVTKTDEAELSCQVTQTESARDDIYRLAPVLQTSPPKSNPNTPTKDVNTAKEIKSVIGDTPTKGVATANSLNSLLSLNSNSVVSYTGSSHSSVKSAPESSKTKRRRKRRGGRSSARLPIVVKKDPEDELLKATKEDSSKEVFVPQLCHCTGGNGVPAKDDEQLFDPKIKYKMELTKTDVDYYPYQPLNLLTPIEGESELCRLAWDPSSAPAAPANYLTPLEAVLDVQRCAAQQADTIDKMIKYGDYGENE